MKVVIYLVVKLFFSSDTLFFRSHEIRPLKNVPFFSEVVYLIKIVLIALFRDGSRAAAISKIERFVIIANGFQLLTITTKHSILDVAAALDPPLLLAYVISERSFPTLNRVKTSMLSTMTDSRLNYLLI